MVPGQQFSKKSRPEGIRTNSTKVKSQIYIYYMYSYPKSDKSIFSLERDDVQHRRLALYLPMTSLPVPFIKSDNVPQPLVT
jgi:hypothetical protein